MEYNMYCIRDIHVGFGYPFVSISDEVALRNFAILKSDPNSVVSKTPDDYQLFSVGTYNTETGLIESWFPRPVVVKTNQKVEVNDEKA